jgi:hypothetical protein
VKNRFNPEFAAFIDAIVERQKAVAAAYVPPAPAPVVQPRRKKARPKT